MATNYPANPNGSPFGIAAITNEDGRVTLTMPHPERSFRYAQNSWRPDGAGEYSGWYRMFGNARRWVGLARATRACATLALREFPGYSARNTDSLANASPARSVEFDN